MGLRVSESTCAVPAQSRVAMGAASRDSGTVQSGSLGDQGDAAMTQHGGFGTSPQMFLTLVQEGSQNFKPLP